MIRLFLYYDRFYDRVLPESESCDKTYSLMLLFPNTGPMLKDEYLSAEVYAKEAVAPVSSCK